MAPQFATYSFAEPQSPRILLVKTSSLGDVLHNLPVVSDIVRHHPGAKIDWVVEEGFAALPRLHPAIHDVIPVAVRRWRRKLLDAGVRNEIAAYRATLAERRYDLAIDTQGLAKSALLMRAANGVRCGYDRASAREPLSAFFYQRTFAVAKGLHAVERNRQLVAQALGYTLDTPADYGILPPSIPCPDWLPDGEYAVLLHATSRDDKLWDEPNWIALAQLLNGMGIRCVLPWGSEREGERSRRLAAAMHGAIVPPRLNLNEAAALLGGARAVVGVDTGLAHLAAALAVPTVGIYTSTDPALTGLYAGRRCVNLGNVGRPPEVAEVLGALKSLGAC